MGGSGASSAEGSSFVGGGAVSGIAASDAAAKDALFSMAFAHQLDWTTTIERKCAGCGFMCYGGGGVNGRTGKRPRVCVGCRENGEALVFHSECNHMWQKHKME